MNFKRLFRHLLIPPWLMHRAFSAAVMQRIEAAVQLSERAHRGELRVAIEACLHPRQLLQNQSPRARAEEVFAQLGVWDTAENSGVLLYINWADRDIEIVADRGISARDGQDEWESVCRVMEQAFRNKRFEAGVLEGIGHITALLSRHFPAGETNPDELRDRPASL